MKINKTKYKVVALFLFLLLLAPVAGNAQNNVVTRENKENIAGRILNMIRESVAMLEKLFEIRRLENMNKLTGSVIQKAAHISEAQPNNCDNYYKICPVSPFGTRKEPLPEIPTSTLPQFTVKYADIKANLARIVYSISDIRDNQTMLWLNYGTSSSMLDHATSRANVSYGIMGRHGIDDADFLIAVPSESVCSYASSTSLAFPDFGAFSIYNPNPPTYYFRIEAQNNLGTFFTPSLALAPLSFQFDNFCGEQTYYYEDLLTDL